MKRQIRNGLLSIVVCYAMILHGCSLTWVGTLDNLVAVAGPALINVLNIVAIAQNKPVNTVLEAKITADFANLKILAADFQKANTTTAPTACQELRAGLAVINDDSAVILSIVQSSGNSNAAIILSSAVAIVTAIVGLIPSCAAPAQVKAEIPAKVAAINVKALVKSYNAVLTKPTGVAAVDSYTSKHKLPEHGMLVHILTFDIVK